MTIWWFYLIAAFIVLAGSAFIYLVLNISKGGKPKGPRTIEDLDEATEKDIKALKLTDIKSMTVKSDSDTKEKYGDKAKNGVVFITTKKAVK